MAQIHGTLFRDNRGNNETETIDRE
jgi:hypothetical protein